MTSLTSRVNGTAVGLDLGTKCVRLVVLSHADSAAVSLETASVTEFPLSRGPESALKAVSGASSHVGRVACNLGPASAIVQQAEYPEMPMDELRSAMLIEAKQLIPDMDNMTMDFQVIGTKAAEEGARSMVVLLVAAPKKAVADRTDLFFKCKLKLSSLVPDGIAIANAVTALRPPQGGATLALDVGAEGTNVVGVPPGDEPVAPIVRYIQGGMLILPQADTVKPAGSEDDRTAEAKRDRWLREVERSVEFIAAKLDSPAKQILVVGEGGRAPHLLSWMEQNLQVSVSGWNPLQDLKRGTHAPAQDFIERYGSDMAVAVGLALTESA